MIQFKVGLYNLNDNANYNYQLNRLINWDGGDLDETAAVSHGIRTHDDWKHTLIRLGDNALKEGRTENAIAYYRMSEFFMSDGDGDKVAYYKKAVDLFYTYYADYFSSGTVERFDVPFGSIRLPVMHAKAGVDASHKTPKGTILLHGGNDSYLEEFFFPMLYFAENGYDVYLFEGPGQGGVLRVQGATFTHEWEKPVTAIIDYFGLDDLVIVGASLGGMLAPRAAAFEKRIKQVIAWSVFPNFLHVSLSDLPATMQNFFKTLLRLRLKGIINAVLYGHAKKDPALQWALNHGMHAYGVKSPYEWIQKMNDFQMLDIADKIDQDVLILQGAKDHFIDWHLYREEIDALTGAKSVTFRLFTDKEAASNHCQCGNSRLVLDTMLGWLETVRAPQ